MKPNDAPGLKRRRLADGTYVYYWIATRVSKDARDYGLRSIRLTGAPEEMHARCRALTAELREWLASRGAPAVPTYDGRIATLIDIYQRDEDSPYRAIRHKTKRQYDESLNIIRGSVGSRTVDTLSRKDFAGWYRGFRSPVAEGKPERLRRATHCMKLLRILFRFGASMRFDGCRAAADILHEMRFEHPAPRRKQLAFEQAKAIVERALSIGRPSIALAQALQFELSLRQKDVIGEWLPAGEGAQGIVHHGKRWTGGVTWSDLSADLVLTKQTTKTAAIGEWNLRSYPLIMLALDAFPRDLVGPVVVSETTQRPYVADDFRIKWRAIATDVGVPQDIWNMDSRAGGITEGDEAGAEPRDLQRHATHASFQTTSRYVRGTLAATEKVATLRVASRKKDAPNA